MKTKKKLMTYKINMLKDIIQIKMTSTKLSESEIKENMSQLGKELSRLIQKKCKRGHGDKNRDEIKKLENECRELYEKYGEIKW